MARQLEDATDTLLASLLIADGRSTLKALAGHTDLGPLLPADGGDCEEVLTKFAKAGIDVDALAAQLQDEGAKSFVKSWNDLMAVIASKSAALNEPALRKAGW